MISMPPELLRRINRAAKAKMQTRSEWLRQAALAKLASNPARKDSIGE